MKEIEIRAEKELNESEVRMKALNGLLRIAEYTINPDFKVKAYSVILENTKNTSSVGTNVPRLKFLVDGKEVI